MKSHIVVTKKGTFQICKSKYFVTSCRSCYSPYAYDNGKCKECGTVINDIGKQCSREEVYG